MATQLFQPPVQSAASISFGGTIMMTADQWIAVRDNPRQRDTETRAKRARHLAELHPAHVKVNMARLTSGETYKLDGHTRAYLWARTQPAGPDTVLADVWDCRSITEVKALYGTFDSKAAVESSLDLVFGSVRDSGISFESELLRLQRFVQAMRSAYEIMFGQVPAKAITVYDLFSYWTPELVLLDECGPSRQRFPSGVAAGALLTLRRYGPEATTFWKCYAVGGGAKINGERDAVQALEERMLRLKAGGGLSGRANVYQIVCICLSAYDSYRNDHVYASGIGSGIKQLGANSLERWASIAARTKRSW